jgi:hypothetical protein
MTQTTIQNSNKSRNEKQPTSEPDIDPVEEASVESFPASDSPGWISRRAEHLDDDPAAKQGDEDESADAMTENESG